MEINGISADSGAAVTKPEQRKPLARIQRFGELGWRIFSVAFVTKCEQSHSVLRMDGTAPRFRPNEVFEYPPNKLITIGEGIARFSE